MKKNIPYFIFIGLVLIVLTIWGISESNAPDFTVFSTKERGASLLFDTLKHMGYPVNAGQMPVNADTHANDVFIIIRPNNPYVDNEMAEAMLNWVKRGGRLIFLDREYPTVMDRAAEGLAYPYDMGGMTHYSMGMGELITGNADHILNRNLMNESDYGFIVQHALYSWDADKIWFVEYYHGYRTAENFYTRLPVVVKLALIQLVIITLAVVWCVGKRFGKPVVYYEEVEREENEHVRALARLYGRIK